MPITQDLQALEGNELIQLIELDGTKFGLDEVLRFHAHNVSSEGWASFVVDNLPSIKWQGKEYLPYPYELKGLELSSTGAQPTPTLSVGNIEGKVTRLCLDYADLVQAKIKIHTTMAKYLDAANWINGNPNADPAQERVQLFYVNSKKIETKTMVEFELCSPFDIQNLQLPTRQITTVCTWCMRGWYRSGTGCDYAGNKYFTKTGDPTDDPAKDVCGGLLKDCKARHGNASLPFGGFPAANLQSK